MILFIDTETTGLPSRYAGDERQPHMVQLAAVLRDDTRRPVARVNHLIRPDGWRIPLEATAIHGFTTEACVRNGVPLSAAMLDVLALWTQAKRIVSYNIDFDYGILALSSRRVGVLLPQRDLYCAMRESAKLIHSNGRWVKLGMAYQCFFGRNFDHAHNAASDVEACREIYYAIADALAPVSRLVGDIRHMRANSLRRAIAGASEVQEHEELLNSLVRVHCTPLEPIDWRAIASQPLPEPPARLLEAEHEAVKRLRSYRPGLFARLIGTDQDQMEILRAAVAAGREQDAHRYQEAMAGHKAALAAATAARLMAKRVLSGDQEAYATVMGEIDLCASPLVGRQVIYSFPDARSVEVFAYLNSSDVIPDQAKKLLASGRVSVKQRSKKDFSQLYQEHLCSAAVRLCRDFMGRLPLGNVLLHVLISGTDSATGEPCERCVISVLVSREGLERVNFDAMDPARCIAAFPVAQKLWRGEFAEIAPLTFAGIQRETVKMRRASKRTSE